MFLWYNVCDCHAIIKGNLLTYLLSSVDSGPSEDADWYAVHDVQKGMLRFREYFDIVGYYDLVGSRLRSSVAAFLACCHPETYRMILIANIFFFLSQRSVYVELPITSSFLVYNGL